MSRFSQIMGRAEGTYTTPKTVVRQIAATKSSRLSMNQCQQLLKAVAYTIEQAENENASS